MTAPSNAIRVSDTQFAQAVQLLGQFVAIPSVSHPNSPYYNPKTLAQAATFAGAQLEKLGFTVSYPCIDKSAPFVIAELITDATKPTLLLYAHYDVQPVDLSKWNTKPFVMTERDGRLYGRGASDDKAGVIGIITALAACKAAEVALPNIKILFEGEEEYGSSHMDALLKKEAKRLDAQALIVLDGLNKDVATGTLTSSTRGLINLELEVNALKKPVHSGIGCLVSDPAQVLTDLIHSLRQPQNIPGFMDGCDKLSKEERRILKDGSVSAEQYAKDMGIVPGGKLRGNANASVYERILSEPSLSVVNMTCGQPNGGNSIQDTARCTIGVRILPGQDPDQIAEAVMSYLKKQKVDTNVQVHVNQSSKGSWAWKADLTAKFSSLYFEALKANFPKTCAMPCGGTLPLLREFQEAFPKMEMLIPAVEDPKTDAHSHNESQDIAVFRRSINSLIHFLDQSGKMKVSAAKDAKADAASPDAFQGVGIFRRAMNCLSSCLRCPGSKTA